jgi:hypothetical protein
VGGFTSCTTWDSALLSCCCLSLDQQPLALWQGLDVAAGAAGAAPSAAAIKGGRCKPVGPALCLDIFCINIKLKTKKTVHKYEIESNKYKHLKINKLPAGIQIWIFIVIIGM